MDEAVSGLVLAPFREIVDKAKQAIENAGDGDSEEGKQMLKAAKGLSREGERALARIEPLCKKHFEAYGSNFISGLKESDEIAQYRTDLNDMLWGFEDYVELDMFEAERFAELQALARKAAPKVYDILMRMKLEAAPAPVAAQPEPEAPASLLSQPTGKGNTTTPRTPTPEIQVEQVDAVVSVEEPVMIMGVQGGPDLGLEGRLPQIPEEGQEAAEVPFTASSQQAPAAPPPPPPAYRVEDIPPEPPVDPWQARENSIPPEDVSAEHNDSDEARRERAPATPVSPISPSTEVAPLFSRPGRLDLGVDRMQREEQDMRLPSVSPGREVPSRMTVDAAGFITNVDGGVEAPRGLAISAATTPSPGDVRPLAPAYMAQNEFFPPTSQPIVHRPSQSGENYPVGHRPSQSGEVYPSIAHLPSQSREGYPIVHRPSQSGEIRPPVSPSQRFSTASTAESLHPSIFDGRGRDSMVSPISDDHRQSVQSMSSHLVHTPSNASGRSRISLGDSPVLPMAPNFGPVLRPPQSHSPRQGDPAVMASPNVMAPPMEQPGLELVSFQIEDGLIPVSSQDSNTPSTSHAPLRQPNCSIDLNSSVYQMKGFCDGAKEIIRGGLGVRKVKKPGMGAGTAIVAKCKSCLFELDWKAVESDYNAAEASNYSTAGVRFRLRFLSKSHLAAKRIDDQLYACLFCVQLGKTTEESDATVFFSQKQLFAHIARHPRPLPPVAGVTVIDGAEVPSQFRNNYDLHFTKPPERSLLAGLTTELALLPTAVAIESFRPSSGVNPKNPPDRQPVLHFAAGAKIVGIEFPERYNGEWCIGWADNQRAAFPLEVIRLDAPFRGGEMLSKLQGASNLKALTRWKWSPKMDKNTEKSWTGPEWLKLEKGEVITNISWPYAEHWCWSGTNAKGKWGIFPQSHIEPNTLMETPSADRASILSNERKGSMLGRMSIRRHSTRPGTSGSHSSGDTATQSPRPSIH